MKYLWWFHKVNYPEDFAFAVAEDLYELIKVVSRDRERKQEYTPEEFEQEFEYRVIRMIGRYKIECVYTD